MRKLALPFLFCTLLEQTVVLMNDLATALDAQGLYDDAYEHVKRASELAHQTEHPETHIVLNNLAGILMHKGWQKDSWVEPYWHAGVGVGWRKL